MQIQNGLELTAMENCVPVHHPFYSTLVLNSTQTPTTEKKNGTSFLSRYVSKPGLEHWTAVKRNIRHLKGTEDLGIVLGF